jgi:ABC-type cobalamin/Fe3+-siderophores transport systems, ATPase components
MIAVSGLSFAYTPDAPVLKNIGFEAGPGEIINILGPNGSGKSTLLKAILGFFPVTRGSIHIFGQDVLDIPKHRLARKLAYVPQNHNGVFHYTVHDVVLMGRTAASPWYRVTEEDHAVTRAAMEKTLVAAHARKPYLQLSGGERQLVLIARALAQGADYFIMDEPVSGLDYGNQFHLLETIRKLSEEGLSFILTTHHPEHAVFLGGRAMLMKNGELLEDGPAASVITAARVCDLYGMPLALLKRIQSIYTEKMA